MKKKLPGPPTDDGAWVYHTVTLKCSMAWRGRSHRAILFTEFLEVENLRHAGLENGNLLAPFNQLVAWGLRRETIAAAIDENIKRKLVVRTGGGVDLDTGKRLPFKYRLTYLPTVGDKATGEWKRYKSAVHVKDPEKVEKSRRATAVQWGQKKQNPGAGFGTHSVPKPALGENQRAKISAKNLVPKPALGTGAETGTTIYISEVSTLSEDPCVGCVGVEVGVTECPLADASIWSRGPAGHA